MGGTVQDDICGVEKIMLFPHARTLTLWMGRSCSSKGVFQPSKALLSGFFVGWLATSLAANRKPVWGRSTGACGSSGMRITIAIIRTLRKILGQQPSNCSAFFFSCCPKRWVYSPHKTPRPSTTDDTSDTSVLSSLSRTCGVAKIITWRTLGLG